jgi:hypothetical protein
MKEPRAVNDSLGQQQRKGKNAMKKKTLAPPPAIRQRAE